MKQIRWHLCLTALALALLALALPGVAAAAPTSNASFSPLAGSIIVDSPTQPTFAVPGIFSLTFGQKAGDAEIDIPAINTVGTVTGLTFSPDVSWESLSLSQKQPYAATGVAIADARLNMMGATKGYSTDAMVQLKLDPSPAFQTSGKFGFRYDGMKRSGGFSLENVALKIAADPVHVTLDAVNTGDAAISFGAMKVEVPAANASMMVDGYKVSNGRADWKAISVGNAPNTAIQFGNIASISQMQLSVAGPSAGYATFGTVRVKVNAEQAKVDGQFYVINDPVTRQAGVALSKGNMAFQVPGWNFQMEGINSVKGGVKVDTISLAAEPLSLTAEMTGVVVSDTAGFYFDQAKMAYAPNGSPANGFAMTVTRNNAGYVVTTTTVLPVAAGR
jgi:hypothetical protein